MATMASHLLVLLLFSAVVSSTTAASATAPAMRAQRVGKPNSNTSTSPPAPLVQSTCNATAYYDLCVAVLLVDPSSSTADRRGLGAIALSAAAADANATHAALANTSSSSSSSAGRLFQACAAKYGEARDVLVDAREWVGEEAYDNALVGVNAAAEYPAVCRRLFRRSGGAYPAELARREVALERLCTVATDIIMPLVMPLVS